MFTFQKGHLKCPLDFWELGHAFVPCYDATGLQVHASKDGGPSQPRAQGASYAGHGVIRCPLPVVVGKLHPQSSDYFCFYQTVKLKTKGKDKSKKLFSLFFHLSFTMTKQKRQKRNLNPYILALLWVHTTLSSLLPLPLYTLFFEMVHFLIHKQIEAIKVKRADWILKGDIRMWAENA